MKKLLFLVIITAFVSCSKEESKWDPSAMIALRPATGTILRSANADHLSAIEIVKQATNISFWNEPIYGHQAVDRGFADWQRDTIAPALMMFGVDIIREDGSYVPDFIEAKDMVLQRVRNPFKPNEVMDTIGYIPNSVMRSAETKIKAAYEAGDFESVRTLFFTAFTFTPITGDEWRELKRQGLQ